VTKRHEYPRARYVAGIVGQDAVLVAALAMTALVAPGGALASALFVAVPAVLAWGFVTLHFPAVIEVSEAQIAFHRYGRVHRFAWSDVARIRVRRFVVRDRVMVRIAPASAWRGRYWVLDSIEGFDALVAELEARASRHSS
jgi:hypothetical protein